MDEFTTQLNNKLKQIGYIRNEQNPVKNKCYPYAFSPANYIKYFEKIDLLIKNNTLQTEISTLFIITLDKEVIEFLQTNETNAIVFDYSFIDEYDLINCLPNTIKYIHFNDNSLFNKPINNLSSDLEYLKLPENFNQPLDNLPYSLRYLIIGSQFVNPYSYSLVNLPINMHYLSFNINKNSPIIDLPDNIKILSITTTNLKNIDKLPKYLEILDITSDIMDFSYQCYSLPNIEYLEYIKEIIIDFEFNKSIESINWPDSIKYLDFGEFFNQSINNLPKYLEVLNLGADFNLEQHIIKNKIQFPSTLKKIIFTEGFLVSEKKFEYIDKCIDIIRQSYPNIEIINNS